MAVNFAGNSRRQVHEAYTADGSLDFDGNPALKHLTGGWRACLSVLGEFLLLPAETDFSKINFF